MSLKDVLGQQKVIQILLNEIKTGKVKHSYVFYGVSGIGKKFTAIQFAKSLLCDNPVDGCSCDECDNCRQIDENTHPDVIIVDFDFQERLLEKPTSTISIATIRYIKQFSTLTPYSGKYKVVIIDFAETLQKEAANSLLKLLEEPVGNFVIILVTTSIGLLPKTVLSRSEQIKFLPLKKEVIEKLVDSKKIPNELVLGSVNEVEYIERLQRSNFDVNNIKNLSLDEISWFVDEIVSDQHLASYMLVSFVEKILYLNSDNINNEVYQFLNEIENYIRQFKFNIDWRLLFTTFLLKVKLLCNKNMLLQ